MSDPAERVFGPPDSHLLLFTRRVGMAAKIGHDLRIEATGWTGRLFGDPRSPAGADLRVEVDLTTLVVREGTGGALPLSDKDRAEIHKNITGVLGAGARAVFIAAGITGAGPDAMLPGTLDLHGVTRPVTLAVSRDGSGRYRGDATVRQSDFGIKPYSALLGALKLHDEVRVECEVALAEPLG